MDQDHSIVDFEDQARERYGPFSSFDGCQNVKRFAISSLRRSEFYVPTLCSDWEEFSTKWFFLFVSLFRSLPIIVAGSSSMALAISFLVIDTHRCTVLTSRFF